MRFAILFSILAVLPAGSVFAGEGVPNVRHVKVFYEKGRFGGWPANYGIWIWGNEILTGFSRGYDKDLGDLHHIDRQKPEEYLLARSLDGGETWSIENPAAQGYIIPQGKALHGTELPGVAIKPSVDCPGEINFQHPDFALTFRMASIDNGPSRFYYTYDRGHNWEGPFRLPDMGTPGVAARTDYIAEGPHACMFFLTAAKANGQEGRPFCARTNDGCKTWEFISYIGLEPSGYAIMPATVRLSKTELFTVIRRRDGDHGFLESYRSEDNGLTWNYVSNPAEDLGPGNPASLIKLTDGRLCLTYGCRKAPFPMCAKLSRDGGQTWSPEIRLREDGLSQDIGYPRSVQRPDGNVVTLYYYCDANTGPERYIAATIWDPAAFK